jgi:hypothetical protein
MKQSLCAAIMALAASGPALFLASSAHADVPAGYQGKPFDPALVGGAGIIPATVKAGPFALPGRLDLVNYDLGGEGVAYHSEAHYTTKDGDGYRTDRPTATMCLTLSTKPDVFYDTATAQDGMAYPTDATKDFYIGSVHPNDWFNYTVDVKTAGMYTLSAVFATGNGPPGGEGGDGEMELVIFVNGVQQADWKTTFPDFQNKANFHNWKPYPKFAMVTLTAGIQIIKFQAPFKHLNLDYVQFDLLGAGGTPGNGGAGGASDTGGAAGTTTSTGGMPAAAGTGSSAGTPGESGGNPASGGAAAMPGGSSAAGMTGVSGSSASVTNDADNPDSDGCACKQGKAPSRGSLAALYAALGLGVVGARRRSARR